MGSIRVHEFISLDGVMENPSWTFEYGFDPRMGAAPAAVMSGCERILLGRRTFEMFEPAWSTRTAADDPGAPFFNDTTKCVVSSTLTEATWRNSEILGAYDPAAIRRLKDSVDGGIYVSGSGRLVRAMLADGLVDQLHLFVYPVALGAGTRLFAGDGPGARLRLSACERYENSVVHLAYESAATPTQEPRRRPRRQHPSPLRKKQTSPRVSVSRRTDRFGGKSLVAWPRPLRRGERTARPCSAHPDLKGAP